MFVRLSADSTGLKKGMKEGASSMDVLKKAAAQLGIALSAGALFRSIIKNSIEAQAAQAQLGAAIASTGGAAGRSIDQLNAHAAALQAVTTFGDEAINSAQSLLLTFTQIKGEAFDGATEAVLDLAQAMGGGEGGLKAASIQVGKALNDPIKGVSALSKVGVSFTESQKAVIKSLAETGRMGEAQALILKELQVEFGGSAKAARNTLGGALQGLANAWGDALEVTGQASGGMIGAINNIGAAIPFVRRAADVFFQGIQRSGSLAAVAVEELRLGWLELKAMGTFGTGKNAILTEIGQTRDQIELLKVAADDVWTGIITGSAFVPPAIARINTELSGLGELSDAAKEALKKLVEEAAKITEGAQTPFEAYTATLAELDAHLAAGRITQGTYTRAVIEAMAAMNAILKVGEELNPMWAESAQLMDSLVTPAEAYAAKLQELVAHYEAGRIGAETFTRAVAAASTVLHDSAKATESFGSAATSVALRGIDNFAAFAVGAGGSISAFVKGAMQDLAKLIARMAIVAALKAAFAGSTGGFGAFVLGALEKRAGGGPVRGGQSYVVGERGPEIFTPSGSGMITANGGGAAISFPPMPRPMSPSEAATQAWFIEAIRIVTRNNVERG